MCVRPSTNDKQNIDRSKQQPRGCLRKHTNGGDQQFDYLFFLFTWHMNNWDEDRDNKKGGGAIEEDTVVVPHHVCVTRLLSVPFDLRSEDVTCPSTVCWHHNASLSPPTISTSRCTEMATHVTCPGIVYPL